MAKKQTLNAIRLGDKGENLIMLHGWGLSANSLRQLGEIFSNFFRVHIIDLPGFGKSKRPKDVWGAREYSECIINYMNNLKIKNAHLLGHSFGGKLAMYISSKYPERVKKLVLICSSGLRPKRSHLKRIKFKSISVLGKVVKRLAKRRYRDWFVPKFASKDYLEAGDMRPILVRSVNEDLAEEISAIKHSALILWGEKDLETPLEIAFRLEKMIENSKLLVCENKGHTPFEDTGAHFCASKILPFLGSER